eukprot:TRINITY_DN4605_c0_g1_i3.p1 TRINITY_DN4605_c0_g1~~TRINITY_DN4605_c0_g1_i3.p1  ORF type:complete len:1216 (+),score=334.68 TRINITY_DN4605_c0_g1_i3:25-3672(+)
MGVPYFFRWLRTKYPKAVLRFIPKTTNTATTNPPNPTPTPSPTPAPTPAPTASEPTAKDIEPITTTGNSVHTATSKGDSSAVPVAPSVVPSEPTLQKTEGIENGAEVPPDDLEEIEVVGEEAVKCDHLYLDMNGIIHNATHGDDSDKAQLSESEMVILLEQKIDSVFNAVRPQKLVYFAVDGVAPRAKMNQQRMRRFMSAEDKKKHNLPFDSNSITPGTEFMQKVSVWLKNYIKTRVSSHPAWQKVAVLFSGSEIPGEGEHKLLAFIRSLKSFPGYNPNTRHIFYGMDADLIFLGLSTHEPYFSILREETQSSGNQFLREPSSTVYLQNLPSRINEDKIHEALGGMGTIKDVRIVRDDQGYPKGFGFVEFQSINDARAWVEDFSSIEIANQKIGLNYAKGNTNFNFPNKPNSADSATNANTNANTKQNNEPKVKSTDTIFVGNLPFRLTEEELALSMRPFGEIIEVRIITDPLGRSKGYGYITFKSEQSVSLATAQKTIEIGGRQVKIDSTAERKVKDSPEYTKIKQFLQLTGSVSNNAAFKYLDGYSWDINAAVEAFKDPSKPVPVKPRPLDTYSPQRGPRPDRKEHHETDASKPEKEKTPQVTNQPKVNPHSIIETAYLLLHLNVLREYINFEFKHIHLYDWPKNQDIEIPQSALFKEYDFGFEYSKVNVINDLIFLSMFVGNDFFPTVPSLELEKRGLDFLWKAYKVFLLGAQKITYPYLLSEDGTIYWAKVKVILEILAKREIKMPNFPKNFFPSEAKPVGPEDSPESTPTTEISTQTPAPTQEIPTQTPTPAPEVSTLPPPPQPQPTQTSTPTQTPTPAPEVSTLPPPPQPQPTQTSTPTQTPTPAPEVPTLPPPQPQPTQTSTPTQTPTPAPEVPTLPPPQLQQEEIKDVPSTNPPTTETPKDDPSPNPNGTSKTTFQDLKRDLILQTKTRYYKDCHSINFPDKPSMVSITQHIIQALSWVVKYYFFGCPSWNYFFGHHYTLYPGEIVEGLQELLVNPEDLNSPLKTPVQFELRAPLLPFEQLVSVLPPLSSNLLPAPYRSLMTQESSPIISYYPTQFVRDTSRKGPDHTHIAILPFIEEEKLIAALKEVEHLLTPEEKARNTNFQYPSLMLNKNFMDQSWLETTYGASFPKEAFTDSEIQSFQYTADQNKSSGTILPTNLIEPPSSLAYEDLVNCVPFLKREMRKQKADQQRALKEKTEQEDPQFTSD